MSRWIWGDQWPIAASHPQVPPHLQRQPTFELLHRCPRDFPIKHETSFKMTIHSINGCSLLYNTNLQRTIWPRQLQYPNLSRQEPRIRVWTDAPACGFRSTKSNVVILRFCWSDPWRPDRNGCLHPLTWIVSECPFSDLHTSFNSTQKNGRYIPLMKPLKNMIFRSTAIQSFY